MAAVPAPPMRHITLVLAAMLALPVTSYLSGSTVGSYRMFTTMLRYRLSLTAITAAGRRTELPLAELSPHLGADARRTVMRASQPVLGETGAELLAGGLDDLGALGCKLAARATRVEVVLERRAQDVALPDARVAVSCAAVRGAR